MSKINIVLDDNEGGVFTVSNLLYKEFIRKKIDSKIINIKNYYDNFLVRMVIGFFELFKSDKDDIYILMHFSPIFLGLFLRIFGFKKLINVVHIDLVAYYQSVGLFKKFVIRFIFLFLKKSLVVFVSKEAMIRAKSFFNLQNVDYIYNLQDVLVSSKKKISTDNKQTKSVNSVRLGIVSRFHNTKNIDLAIRVVKQLVISGHKVELIIFGDGPEKEKLIQYIQQQGCSNYIKIAGYSNNKDEIFNSFDALISFSSIEGLPTIILEAFLFKKPVFFTNCYSGVRELINPKTNPLHKTDSFEITKAGFLVKPISNKDLRPYAKDISEGELLYVEYLSQFIKRLKSDFFKIPALSEEFDTNYIICRWLELFNRIEQK